MLLFSQMAVGYVRAAAKQQILAFTCSCMNNLSLGAAWAFL